MTAALLEDPPKGQLEFQFEGFGLGTLEEAREIFEACGTERYKTEESNVPQGWERIGSGGTRCAFLSPSGIIYKIQHESDEDGIRWNEMEYRNMTRIKREGKLPPQWRVPETHLFSFTANFTRYNRKLRKEVVESGRVAVISMEYIPGGTIGYGSNEADRREMREGFKAAGLYDAGGANAVKTDDGIWYIIDAAESESTEDA